MDVLPAHLNRDSFRDSLKGLVALEIMSDSFWFSNKQHYLSLRPYWYVSVKRDLQALASSFILSFNVSGSKIGCMYNTATVLADYSFV